MKVFFLAAFLAVYVTSSIAAGQQSPSVAAPSRPAWEWTDDERIAQRNDRADMHSRAVRYLAHAATAASSEPGSEPFIIEGRSNPELFLPSELLNNLLNSYDHDAVSTRERYKSAIAASGWGEAAFWHDIDVFAADYRAKSAESVALQQRAIHVGGAEGRATAQQVEALGPQICAARASVFRQVSKKYGATALRKFLYTAVAPTLTMNARGPIDAATLRWLEGGCQ